MTRICCHHQPLSTAGYLVSLPYATHHGPALTSSYFDLQCLLTKSTHAAILLYTTHWPPFFHTLGIAYKEYCGLSCVASTNQQHRWPKSVCDDDRRVHQDLLADSNRGSCWSLHQDYWSIIWYTFSMLSSQLLHCYLCKGRPACILSRMDVRLPSLDLFKDLSA